MEDAATYDIGKFICNAANIGVLVLGWALHRIISTLDKKIEQIDSHLQHTDSQLSDLKTSIALINQKNH